MREFDALKIAIGRLRVVTAKIDEKPKSMLGLGLGLLIQIGTRAKKIGVTLDKYEELYAWCMDKLAPDPPAPAPSAAKLNELWCKLRF